MGKRTGGLLCVLLLALLPAGCQFIRIEEGERTPLEYTIVKQEEIPDFTLSTAVRIVLSPCLMSFLSRKRQWR